MQHEDGNEANYYRELSALVPQIRQIISAWDPESESSLWTDNPLKEIMAQYNSTVVMHAIYDAIDLEINVANYPDENLRNTRNREWMDRFDKWITEIRTINKEEKPEFAHFTYVPTATQEIDVDGINIGRTRHFETWRELFKNPDIDLQQKHMLEERNKLPTT